MKVQFSNISVAIKNLFNKKEENIVLEEGEIKEEKTSESNAEKFNFKKEPKMFFVLEKINVKYQYLFFTSLAFLSAGGAIGLLSYISERGEQLTTRTQKSASIQMLSQRLAKNVQKALAGDLTSYRYIKQDMQSLDSELNSLSDGEGNFKKLESELIENIAMPTKEIFNTAKPEVSKIQAGKDIVALLSAISDDIGNRSKGLQKSLDEIYILGYQRGLKEDQLLLLSSLSKSILNFSKNIEQVATTSKGDVKLIAELNSDFNTINRLVKALSDKDGQEAITDKLLLKEVDSFNAKFKAFNTHLPFILTQVKPLLEGKESGLAIVYGFESIYNIIAELKEVSSEEQSLLDKLDFLVLSLALSTFLFILLLGYINLKQTQKQAWLNEKQAWLNKKEADDTDQAVISLMEELLPISEGNLKARTTVTEHVTGALADRINYMSESLQEAVKKTRATSEDVSNKMLEVEKLIEESSFLSKEAEEAARKSNDSSVTGSRMVAEAAEKMENARSKMQETSKRVKRLGEVSQSIGLVTDLIEEMTEKTAILALNTQLKAAESGSEGNSFRVIAEEIRKLSEEAKKSLSTIRVSVQNMQSETQTVMVSIEQTTANVVEGSKLWEQAEKDLEQIQEAASMIEKITLKLNKLSSEQVEKAKETEEKVNNLNTSISHFIVDED